MLFVEMQIDAATMESFVEFPKKKKEKRKIELPYDSTIPLLVIYLD